jgi:hypothetical protein
MAESSEGLDETVEAGDIEKCGAAFAARIGLFPLLLGRAIVALANGGFERAFCFKRDLCGLERLATPARNVE